MVHTDIHTMCARFLDQHVALRSSYLLVYIIKKKKESMSTIAMIEWRKCYIYLFRYEDSSWGKLDPI